MPLRIALNVVYAMLTEGLDAKQRHEFDESLYGWGEINERANQELRRGLDESGGEG